MILCDDWRVDTTAPLKLDILGVLGSIQPASEPPYPYVHPELCVFLMLTECRGTGLGQIICVAEESGQRVFETPRRTITFTAEPLDIVAVPFRIRGCPFPHRGVYLLEFWYNDEKLEERPLRLR
jgi:hypothetical protein